MKLFSDWNPIIQLSYVELDIIVSRLVIIIFIIIFFGGIFNSENILFQKEPKMVYFQKQALM